MSAIHNNKFVQHLITFVHGYRIINSNLTAVAKDRSTGK